LQALEPTREAASGRSEHLTELKFSELELASELHKGIADAGFTYCTPIQSKTLPIALAGRDVAGQAQTGTGKTAAYLIALYQYLLTHEPLESREPGPRALILAPTRELAVQIHSDATLLGAHLPFKLGLAFGGTDYEKQKRHLADGVDLLIGTPGRLIDFFKQGVFHLRCAQVTVLDEADRMFDLGFLRDIRYILRRLPRAEQRLNMLFSATLSYRVLELAYEHMNDPELVRIEPDKLTVDRIRQSIYFPSNDQKLPLLVTLLREMDATRTMVFVNTRREADRLSEYLEHFGIQAAALSGDVPQRKRLQMLRGFQAGELPVLIATDVASRGLHVPDVSHVFNYDLPQDAEDYVHRIGRTARAGAFGDAISFGCEDYVVSLPEIEAYIGRKIPVAAFDHDKIAELSLPPRSRRSSERRPRGSGERRSGERRPRSSGERRSGERSPRGGEQRPRTSGEREERGGSERPRRDGEASARAPEQPRAARAAEAAGGATTPASRAGKKRKRSRRKRRDTGDGDKRSSGEQAGGGSDRGPSDGEGA
jgi:ATP-dependent RNA helicase RhlB